MAEEVGAAPGSLWLPMLFVKNQALSPRRSSFHFSSRLYWPKPLRRVELRVNSRILTLALASLAFALGACDAETEEVYRVTSPDGVVDAVMLRKNDGATVPYVYEVHVVPKGEKTDEDFRNFVADHVSDLEIAWQAPKLLKISYAEARIFEFSNFWQSADVQDFKYVVELRLAPASDSFSLSTPDRNP